MQVDKEIFVIELSRTQHVYLATDIVDLTFSDQ